MKLSKNISKLGFIIYFILLVWLILFKLAVNIENIPSMQSVNLIPFSQSVIINGKLYIDEIIYNAIVFIPLGMYMMIFNFPKDFLNKLSLGVFVSLLLEITQYVFAIGASDITDIISNSSGTFIGMLFYIILLKIFNKKTEVIVSCTILVFEILMLALYGFLLAVNV